MHAPLAFRPKLPIITLLGLGLLACSPEAGKPKGPPEGAFVVSEYFAPSGAMGDGATPANLVIAENKGCKERPEGARGSCYKFDYTPGPDLNGLPPVLWAGVYWQHPANNWGQDPGLPVHGEKLTKVTFQAAVGEGMESIKFVLGGIGVPRLPEEAEVYPNNDQMMGMELKSVTTDYQKFELTVPLDPTTQQPITSLLGAFAWYANYAPDTDYTTATPKTIYIDDLAYE